MHKIQQGFVLFFLEKMKCDRNSELKAGFDRVKNIYIYILLKQNKGTSPIITTDFNWVCCGSVTLTQNPLTQVPTKPSEIHSLPPHLVYSKNTSFFFFPK